MTRLLLLPVLAGLPLLACVRSPLLAGDPEDASFFRTDGSADAGTPVAPCPPGAHCADPLEMGVTPVPVPVGLRVCCDFDAICGEGRRCAGGRCVEAGSSVVENPCFLDCATTPFYDLYFGASAPVGTDVERSVAGTVAFVGPEGFTVKNEAGTEAFDLVRPAGQTIPFAVGEEITVRYGTDGAGSPAMPRAWAELWGAEGARYAVLGGRADEVLTLLGVTLHTEDTGCSANVIGDCVLSRNILVVAEDGKSAPQLLTHGMTETVAAELGYAGQALLSVQAAVYDENACVNPEAHGPRVLLEMVAQ